MAVQQEMDALLEVLRLTERIRGLNPAGGAPWGELRDDVDAVRAVEPYPE